MSDEGVRIVLSPTQLSAVLGEANISADETYTNRLWGAGKVILGGLELLGASALILAPEPTMATKVGGVVLAVHGSDTTAAGIRQVISGRNEQTLTQQGAAGVARLAGAEDDTAETIGLAIDILVPVVVAGAVGAARALATRAGRLSLLTEEAAGGHTIARHVAKTEAELRARLAAQTGIPAASSFKTLAVAEKVLSDALRANATAIRTWSSSAAGANRLRLTYEASEAVGYGVIRATGRLENMKKVLIVLEKTNIQGKIYYILTSYPIP